MNVLELKQLLTQFLNKEREIDNVIARIEYLEEKMTAAGSPKITDMPKAPSPAGDRLMELVQRKVDLEARVKEMIREQDRRKQVYEEVIEKLKDPDQNAVITFRYLDSMKWDRICDALYGDEESYLEKKDSYMRRVMRLHGWALQEMVNIINRDNYLL